MCPLGQEGTGLDLGTVRQQGHCRSDSGMKRGGGEDWTLVAEIGGGGLASHSSVRRIHSQAVNEADRAGRSRLWSSAWW